MNCHGLECKLKHSCRRFTNPVGDEYYPKPPAWNNFSECEFHLKLETLEEMIEARNEEKRERFKNQLS